MRTTIPFHPEILTVLYLIPSVPCYSPRLGYAHPGYNANGQEKLNGFLSQVALKDLSYVPELKKLVLLNFQIESQIWKGR